MPIPIPENFSTSRVSFFWENAMLTVEARKTASKVLRILFFILMDLLVYS
jgi:hypothetical protein